MQDKDMQNSGRSSIDKKLLLLLLLDSETYSKSAIYFPKSHSHLRATRKNLL